MTVAPIHRFLCALILLTTSCRESEVPRLGANTEALDFSYELLIAVADSGRCLYAVGEVPKIDFMETVIRDQLILNELKATGHNKSGADGWRVRDAEWRGRNIVLLLTAAEPLLEELLDSISALSVQMTRLAQSAPQNSTDIPEVIREQHQKVEALREAVRLGMEVTRHPETTYYDGIYHPKIRAGLQEVFGELHALKEHNKPE